MKLRVFTIGELFLFYLMFGSIILLYKSAFYKYLEKCIIFLSYDYGILDCLSTRLIVATIMFLLFLFVCLLGAIIFHFFSIGLNKLFVKK